MSLLLPPISPFDSMHSHFARLKVCPPTKPKSNATSVNLAVQKPDDSKTIPSLNNLPTEILSQISTISILNSDGPAVSRGKQKPSSTWSLLSPNWDLWRFGLISLVRLLTW